MGRCSVSDFVRCLFSRSVFWRLVTGCSRYCLAVGFAWRVFWSFIHADMAQRLPESCSDGLGSCGSRFLFGHVVTIEVSDDDVDV